MIMLSTVLTISWRTAPLINWRSCSETISIILRAECVILRKQATVQDVHIVPCFIYRKDHCEPRLGISQLQKRHSPGHSLASMDVQAQPLQPARRNATSTDFQNELIWKWLCAWVASAGRGSSDGFVLQSSAASGAVLRWIQTWQLRYMVYKSKQKSKFGFSDSS